MKTTTYRPFELPEESARPYQITPDYPLDRCGRCRIRSPINAAFRIFPLQPCDRVTVQNPLYIGSGMEQFERCHCLEGWDLKIPPGPANDFLSVTFSESVHHLLGIRQKNGVFWVTDAGPEVKPA